MKIKILGTRGEIEASAPYHSRHSGVLVDKKLMFDVGEKEFLKYKPKHIFITHLHPDHAFFVREKEKIKYSALKGGRIDSYNIIAIPTVHSKKVKSRAYLIKRGRQKVLYTGDMIWINKKYHNLFKNLDLVITEGSFIRKGGMIRRDKTTGDIYGHNGIPDLINLFKRFTKHILFMHFGTWFYENTKEARKKLQELGKENGVMVLVGYDGMEIDVNKLKISNNIFN